MATTRSFWCWTAQREVEVEFATMPRRLLGRRVTGVSRCTRFEEPGEVTCRRACIQRLFRHGWPEPAGDEWPMAPRAGG
jgi:hypothetical protein